MGLTYKKEKALTILLKTKIDLLSKIIYTQKENGCISFL